MPEADTKAEWLTALQRDFRVQEEVWGHHCSGRRLRVDAVLRPIRTAEWKNPGVALGIEFKDDALFAKSYDTKDWTRWLAQCVDYTHTEWEGYGLLYVFACPGIVDGVPSHLVGDGTFLRNFMGQLGIGELRRTAYGRTLVLHGHHRLWSESNGVEEGRRYTLRRKVGSR